ncbi:MAG: endolytic transglycosylase MltG [Syntrophomonas sp.]
MSEIELRKVKPKVYITALGFLAIILLFSAYQSYLNHQMLPVDPQDKQSVDVVIPAASNARQIASVLKQHNLIRSESIFSSYCRRNNLDNQLKAGHFQFSRSQSLQEIVLTITQGKTVSLTLTIPEGYTVKQIGELLVKRKICSTEQWQQAIQKDYSYEFLDAAGKSHGLEGFLFPDTYSISEKPTAEEILNKMLKNFDKVWNTNFAGQAQAKNIDMYQTITLASMIEKEARLGSERKTISGVIQNRLKSGMPLQIDATVVYCLGGNKNTVTYQDLKVDSPYNTYKYSGLPPGPIACPGKAAIEAALNPAKHSYYYYVAKGDGSHYFSRTYAEHLQAKAKYIK